MYLDGEHRPLRSADAKRLSRHILASRCHVVVNIKPFEPDAAVFHGPLDIFALLRMYIVLITGN
jgi:hypothetical protein